MPNMADASTQRLARDARPKVTAAELRAAADKSANGGMEWHQLVDRVRDAADVIDALHLCLGEQAARLADLDADGTRLRAAIRAAADELAAEHRPEWASEQVKAAGAAPVGCVICFPQDGSWPCTSKMVADELTDVASSVMERLGPAER